MTWLVDSNFEADSISKLLLCCDRGYQNTYRHQVLPLYAGQRWTDAGACHASPGAILGFMRFTAAATETRWSLQFTVGADTKKVWIRFQGLGGVGRLRLMKLNLTKDATVQPYRDYFKSGR